MNLSEPVFDYCERKGADFWAEPLNAVTNGAFLIAACAAFLLWRRRDRDDYPALALIVSVGAVGVGSFVFHTVATRGTEFLDVIPISIFIYSYFFIGLRRFFRLGAPSAVSLLLFFAACSYATSATIHGLNGSVEYLPALVALVVFSLMLWCRTDGTDARSRQAAVGLASAAIVFGLSLVFRSIDRSVCDQFSVGTHFFWHLLNAYVLWLLVRTIIAYATPSAKA